MCHKVVQPIDGHYWMTYYTCMARLKISSALLNRNSVLSIARVQFVQGQNPTLDSVVSEIFSPEDVAYEAKMISEYENYGTFGGQY